MKWKELTKAFISVYDDFKFKKMIPTVYFENIPALSLPFNPLTAKLFNLNFHPLEVVSR